MDWDSSGGIYSTHKNDLFKELKIPVVYVKTEKDALRESFLKKERFCIIIRGNISEIDITNEKLKEIFSFVSRVNFDRIHLTPNLKKTGVCSKRGNFYLADFYNHSGAILYSRDCISKLEKDPWYIGHQNYGYYPGLFYTDNLYIEKLLENYTYYINFDLVYFLFLALIIAVVLLLTDPVKKILYLVLIYTLAILFLLNRDSF